VSRTIAIGVAIVVVTLAAAIATLIATRQTTPAPVTTGPLKVGTDVAIKVTPSQGGCGTTFTFVATGSLSGVGKLSYRWEQSDGRNTPDLEIVIDKTVGSFDLHQSWRLEGSQEVKGSMTFHILAPQQRSAAAKIAYSCS
jgi:hypothetical protein